MFSQLVSSASLNAVIRKQRNRWSTVLGQGLIGIKPSDTFIAAHPRSGSTWLRTMITNTLIVDANGAPDVFNRLIPAVSIRNVPAIRKLDHPRIIMTHGNYSRKMRKVVYVVRDGRDAVLSYFYYQTKRAGIELDFSEFYKRYREGEYGTKWEEHVELWSNAIKCDTSIRAIVIRYEEMKSNIDLALRRVLDFLNIEATDSSIKLAAAASTIAHMRAYERAEHGGDLVDERSFYRSGKIGAWQEQLSFVQRQKLNSDLRSGLLLMGYSTEFEQK